MIEEIGIDSIHGYGKTNKLGVYITYNFGNLLESNKTLHWASEEGCSRHLTIAQLNMITFSNF